MDFQTVLIALPIFIVLYKGIGMLLDAHEENSWGKTHRDENKSSAKEALKNFSSAGDYITVNKFLLRSQSFSDRLDLLLLRCGNPIGWKAADLLFCKELVGIGLLVFMVYTMRDQPVMWLAGLILGFMAPDFYFSSKGSTRRSEIQRLLPGFVDLTALALESGLDLMAAVERILEKMKPSSLKEELGLLLQESRLGTARKEALEHFAHRIYLPDVQSLTSIIIQSEELGTSLATVLRNYAEDMRNRRILRAEEIAGKAPVKMLLPMMIFFFPIVFVIIFGPLALNFVSNYK